MENIKKNYLMDELEEFINDYLKQKSEVEIKYLKFLHSQGMDEIYSQGMLDGLVNGIIMCGGKVDGIETD